MNRSGKFHALLATSRVANVPSVIINVLLGAVIGLLHGDAASTVNPPLEIGLLAAAGVLLYIGGNFLNDWMDRGWDEKHRPERALPRGLFPPALYLAAAAGLGAAGVLLAAVAGKSSALVAALIVVFIVLYTVFHKRTAWAVVPMGLCRALLPVMGCVAFHPYIDPVWPAAAALLCYIAGLSLAARYESLAEPPRWVGFTSRGLLLGTAVFMAWGLREYYVGRWIGVAGALPYLAWTGWCLRFRRRPVPKLVAGLLAGIPLVDWMILLPLGITVGGAFSGDVFGVLCVVLPPLAFLSALLLQRLAPAT